MRSNLLSVRCEIRTPLPPTRSNPLAAVSRPFSAGSARSNRGPTNGRITHYRRPPYGRLEDIRFLTTSVVVHPPSGKIGEIRVAFIDASPQLTLSQYNPTWRTASTVVLLYLGSTFSPTRPTPAYLAVVATSLTTGCCVVITRRRVLACQTLSSLSRRCVQ